MGEDIMWTWEAMDPVKGVIVIVHGASEHHGRYEWLRNKWLMAHFHVVQGDLPGQGKHPKKRGHVDSFDDYIQTITNWIEVANEYHLPTFILGHSLGGLSVIRTLQETSCHIDGVVLSSPSLGLVTPPPRWVVSIARFIDQMKPDFLFPIKKSPVNHHATRNKKVLERDRTDSLIVKKVSARWYLELEGAMELAFQKMDQFPDCPLLILQGGDDKIVNKHAVLKWYEQLSLTNSSYKEFKGLYHEVFNEPEREQVFQTTYDFICQLM